MKPKLLHLLLLLVLPVSNIFAEEIIHSPRQLAIPGEDIEVVAGSNKIGSFDRMELYVRTNGSTAYIMVPMMNNGRKFNAKIPGHFVKDLGTEYYLAAYTAGQKITLPKTNPDSNPFKIKIDKSQLNNVIDIISPKPDSKHTDRRPNIAVSISKISNSIDVSSIQLELDGKDISNSIQYSAGHIAVILPVDLIPGEHKLFLKFRSNSTVDYFQESWSFTILEEDIEAMGDAWKTQTSLSGNYQYSKTMSKGGNSNLTNPNGYATANLSFSAERNKEKLTIGPLNYTTQEMENQQLAQSFGFSYSNPYFETKWGNISASLNQLGGGGSIAGGEIVVYTQDKEKKDGFRFQVDSGRTVKPVEASEENDFVGVYAQRLYATKIDYYAGKDLEISTSLMDVRDLSESLENPGPMSPLENQAFALGFKQGKIHNLVDSLNAEFGISRAKLMDQENQQATEEYLDFGLTANTNKAVKELNSTFNFSFSEYRPEFLFLYGGAGSDSRSTNVGGNTNIGSSTSVSYSHSWSTNNLDGKKDTTNNSNSFNSGLNLNFQGWPTFSLNDSLALQDTKGNPESSSKSTSNSLSTSLSMSHSITLFQLTSNFSWNTSNNYSITNTQSISKNEKQESVSQSASLSYSPSNYLKILSPSLSYSITGSFSSGTPEISYTDSSGINLTLPFTKSFGLPWNGSYSRSWNSTGTTSSQNYSVGTSLSHKVGVGSLSLNLSYSGFNDHNNPESDYIQYTIGVSYNAIF